MTGDVEYDDLQDLKKWIESLEDDFEPMLGVPDEGHEDSCVTVLDHKSANPQDGKEPRLEIEDKLGGTVQSNTV